MIHQTQSFFTWNPGAGTEMATHEQINFIESACDRIEL